MPKGVGYGKKALKAYGKGAMRVAKAIPKVSKDLVKIGGGIRKAGVKSPVGKVLKAETAKAAKNLKSNFKANQARLAKEKASKMAAKPKKKRRGLPKDFLFKPE